ncbi:Pre-mRNA-splicing factor ATP-dependent RNA helicase prp22 [Fusarium odoratissimum]|uniref:Pre-mRNA-splicing factor ATP-dependent RNA helicase prp22 n=1 Tax=Fusarium oxysporum f. sp. cubense (strain race 4) TaxID=2502994 RepID=N1S5Y9_FUSC4|nr:Pre-mRNA-splicing factor ATP-dependent RNA helicase prp22 [Fusarium odoratissimum]
MDDLSNLELLSLVSKVSSELKNHMNLEDKTVAEFLIDKRTKCSNFEDFRDDLAKALPSIPLSLIESIDRLVLALHPQFKGKKANHEEHHSRTLEEKEKVFSGLALPDKEPARDDGSGAFDDTLALLEGLEGKAKKEKSTRKRSRSPREADYKESRRRRRSRSRERRKRDKYRSRSRSHERGDEDWRDGYRDSRKDRRGRRRHDDDDDRFRNAPAPEVDDSPQLHKVYEGHVTGLKEFGAFINLHNVRGRVDGLVHVSRMIGG